MDPAVLNAPRAVAESPCLAPYEIASLKKSHQKDLSNSYIVESQNGEVEHRQSESRPPRLLFEIGDECSEP